MVAAGAQTVDQLWKVLEEAEERRGSEGAAGESEPDAQDEVHLLHAPSHPVAELCSGKQVDALNKAVRASVLKSKATLIPIRDICTKHKVVSGSSG